MKLLWLLTFAAAAFAQVPAHSVVGSVTIDVADVTIPVPYGAGTETKAAISVCSDLASAFATLSISSADSPFVIDVAVRLVKTASGSYCGVALAAARSRDIMNIDLSEMRYTRVVPAPSVMPQASAESKVSGPRVLVVRPL